MILRIRTGVEERARVFMKKWGGAFVSKQFIIDLAGEDVFEELVRQGRITECGEDDIP